jgi:hypothetical protein
MNDDRSSEPGHSASECLTDVRPGESRMRGANSRPDSMWSLGDEPIKRVFLKAVTERLAELAAQGWKSEPKPTLTPLEEELERHRLFQKLVGMLCSRCTKPSCRRRTGACRRMTDISGHVAWLERAVVEEREQRVRLQPPAPSPAPSTGPERQRGTARAGGGRSRHA